MKARALFVRRPPWSEARFGGWTVIQAGFADQGRGLADILAKSPGKEIEAFEAHVSGLPGCFGLIVQGPGLLLAAVDRVRGHPVFYAVGGDGLTVSNSARDLREAKGLFEPDPDGLLEFRLSGFVTGPDTTCLGLKQLRAGELLVLADSDDEPQTRRYYRFFPDREETPSLSDEEWVEALAQETGRIFDRLVETAAGRPIWVPLSGGLDSRLIVCMLARRNCELQTFSYGLPGNYEAKVARRVAGHVGVPWRFEPVTRAAFRDFFRSNERREYWDFCDHLSVVPNMQDFLPLKDMLARGRIPGNALIVNGQSGDFITGGHIPRALEGREGSWEIMLDALIKKHFSRWRDSMSPENMERIEMRLARHLSEVTRYPGEYPNKAALYEFWEWQERQCKYVVNGQRVYDWLGLDWSLPLWEREYLDFWPGVPVRLKYGQELYKRWLITSDFYGVFANFEDTVWRWPGAAMAFVPLARLAGLVGGPKAKAWVYDYCSYFGHYGHLYAGFGLGYFLRNVRKTRGAMAMFIDVWLKEAQAQNGGCNA